MTHQYIAVEGLTEDENTLTNRLLTKLAAHRNYNIDREALYEMAELAPQMSKVLPPHYSQLGFSLGWIAKGVDGLANRCNVRTFTHPDLDLDAFGYSKFIEDNRALSEFAQARTSSLIHGPSFLVNTVGAEGEPASLLHARSALDATGDFDRRTRRMRNLISVFDADANGNPTSFAIYLPDLTITCAKVPGKGWTLIDRQTHSWGLPVEVLRYRPRGRRPFGTSRISPAAMSHQAAALRELARLEGHMDVFSWPDFWLLGADEAVFGGNARLGAMLGRVKAIPDDPDADNPRAEIKQFAAASPEPHMQTMNLYAKLIAREFDLPDASFALTDYANPTSPDSYIEGRDELLATAEVAMDEWSLPLAHAVRRGLAMQVDDPAAFDALSGLKTLWRSPLHLSRAAEADAGAKTVAALSEEYRATTVAFELLGLSDEQIARMEAEVRRSKGRTALAAVVQAASREAK